MRVSVCVVGALMLSAFAAAEGPLVSYTATADKIAGAPDTVRIDLFRWSSDGDRDKLVAAWSMTNTGRGGRGGAGRGAGRGGRGGRGAAASEDDPAPDPAADDNGDPFGTFGTAARRGGRGRGAAAAEPAAPPPTPEGTLATALKQAATIGYVWTSETAGYAVRYAARFPAAAGGERIILITDRRLGANTDFWSLTGNAAPPDYQFSVIELHMSARGDGEGRISLSGKVAPDAAAKVVVPENYDALPVVLKNVKTRQEAK